MNNPDAITSDAPHPAMMNVSTPQLLTRIKSTFVDALVLILLMYLSSLLLEYLAIESGTVRGVLFGLIWLYEPIASSIDCTLGQYLLSIRVRKFQPTPDGNPPRINLLQALVRFVVKLALGWLSLVFISGNTYRRALHDYASGSFMMIAEEP